MDFERDYILRMIHMMGELMRRIAERMDDWERNRELDETCRALCGIPLETAETLAFESLRELLAPTPRMMLSELLYAKAQASVLPYGKADTLLLLSLRLLASLHAETQLCDLRAQRLLEIKTAVYPLLNPEDLMACARFFAQAECYDAMEDALFQALETPDCQAQAQNRTEAIAMLHRAAQATGQALAMSHMTGEELRDSARELEMK